mgnify:FL=1
MASNPVSSPPGLGGLMRYDEEYESKFNLKPTHVIIFVVLVLGFRLLLPFIM